MRKTWDYVVLVLLVGALCTVTYFGCRWMADWMASIPHVIQ